MIEIFVLLQSLTPATSVGLTVSQFAGIIGAIILYTSAGVVAFSRLSSNSENNKNEISELKDTVHECRRHEDEKTSKILDILQNHSAMLGELKGDIKAHNSYHDGINKN